MNRVDLNTVQRQGFFKAASATAKVTGAVVNTTAAKSSLLLATMGQAKCDVAQKQAIETLIGTWEQMQGFDLLLELLAKANGQWQVVQQELGAAGLSMSEQNIEHIQAGHQKRLVVQ